MLPYWLRQSDGATALLQQRSVAREELGGVTMTGAVSGVLHRSYAEGMLDV